MVRPRLWSRFKQGRCPRPDGSHSVPITVPPLSVSHSARLPEGAGQFSRGPIQANGWFKSNRTRRLVGALRRKPVHEAPRTPNSLSHSVLQGTSLSRTQGLGLTSPWPGARACQAGSQAAGNLQHVNLGELCPWMGCGGVAVCVLLPASLPQTDAGSESRRRFKGLNSQVNPEVWNFQNILTTSSSGGSRRQIILRGTGQPGRDDQQWGEQGRSGEELPHEGRGCGAALEPWQPSTEGASG